MKGIYKKGEDNMRDGLLYCCYSKPQKDFLTSHGIKYEIGGKSMSTDNPFWVYIRTEKLSKLLDEWTLGSKS